MGPFEHWPTGSGFEHFYGFLGGETNQYAPALYKDTVPIELPTIQSIILRSTSPIARESGLGSKGSHAR